MAKRTKQTHTKPTREEADVAFTKYRNATPEERRRIFLEEFGALSHERRLLEFADWLNVWRTGNYAAVDLNVCDLLESMAGRLEIMRRDAERAFGPRARVVEHYEANALAAGSRPMKRDDSTARRGSEG